MKKVLKYWPMIPFVLVLAAILCFSACTEQTDVGTETNTGTESFIENDPERVTISSEEFDRITSNFGGFVETTDEEDTSDTTGSGSASTGNGSASTGNGGLSGTIEGGTADTDSPTDDPDLPTNSTGTSTSTSTSTSTNTNTNTGSGGTSDDPIDKPVDPPVVTNISDKALYSTIASSRKKSSSHLTGLEINGVPLVFDESSKTYLYSISERAVNTTATYAFSGKCNNESLQVVFKNGEIGSNGKFKATANQTMSIRIFTDTKYYDCDLRMSIVPVISIEIENRQTLPNNKTTTLYCTVTVHNPDGDVEPGDEYVASYATIHNRGASSMSYPKKSMKIELQKFVEENGKTVMQERNKRLLGMRDDDDWILDANYADPTMMHNKMAYNLWEEIGGNSNPDAIMAGPHCEYAEVVLNGKYHGLFLLVEPVDEKQMGVQKSENTEDGSHGVYIKAGGWDLTKFDSISGTPFGSNGSGKTTWAGFEMKYPENKISAADWNPLYELLAATAPLKTNQNDENIANFRKVASKLVRKENIVNYWILISVILARDNAGKNIHYSITNLSDPNMKIYINAWDMDNSFGYRYGPSSSGPVKDPVTTKNYADDWFKLLRYYIKYDVDGAASYLQTRWAELTKAGGPCTVESLTARIDREAAYLESSGAFLREQARWPATGSFHASLPNPLATEVEYAKQWITDRIPVVDGIVKGYKK